MSLLQSTFHSGPAILIGLFGLEVLKVFLVKTVLVASICSQLEKSSILTPNVRRETVPKLAMSAVCNCLHGTELNSELASPLQALVVLDYKLVIDM